MREGEEASTRSRLQAGAGTWPTSLHPLPPELTMERCCWGDCAAVAGYVVAPEGLPVCVGVETREKRLGGSGEANRRSMMAATRRLGEATHQQEIITAPACRKLDGTPACMCVVIVS